jgi:hypothetical protein
VAHDLLFSDDTDADWSRSPSVAAPRALALDFTATERKSLKTLEPTTASFAVNIIGWARNQGIPASLSHTTIYTPEDSAKYYDKGGSSIKPGRLDWHNVGRAFHIIIPPYPKGSPDLEAYAKIGKYARSQGGEWLGDRPFKNSRGQTIYDTAHFEYHPGVDIATYRQSKVAETEFAQAQKRARRFA